MHAPEARVTAARPAFWPAAISTQEVRAALASFAARLQVTIEHWKRRRHAKAAASGLRRLDGRTLRDIGFHRSEIESVAAELAGLAEPTRANSARSMSSGYWSRS